MTNHQTRPAAAHSTPDTRHSRWRLRFGAFLALGFWCLLILSSTFAVAQNLAIDWFTIDGGGGTSTGGVFSVSGTIGQPDAGKMSGGNFSIDGGFWGIIAAVQTPGAPVLTITRTPTNTVVVSWPSSSTGFNLQQNSNLSTPNWVTPSESVQNNGTNKFIIEGPPLGSRFYRLFKP